MTNTESRTTFFFPTTGVGVQRQAILFAIDDVSLPLKKNLCYYLTRPTVRPEPVLTPRRDDPNAADSFAAHFYGTVLYEGGRFRMWYYACHLGRNPDWPPALQEHLKNYPYDIFTGPLCYAESRDGLHWERPRLGQLLFKGSRENNAFDLPNALTSCATVIRDDDDPDPARRYKMVYEFWDYGAQLHCIPRFCTGSDGVCWTVRPDLPIRDFVEQASFYKFNGMYFVNHQKIGPWCPSEGGADRGRQGFVHVSPDFEHWLAESAESFTLPDPARPEDRGFGKRSDQAHLGVGAAPFGNVLIGLYCIWHDHPQFGQISGDLGLVVSNDGVAFREPVKGHVWLASRDSPATPVPGKNYPTILCQANGILNVGDETRIYHGRWRNVDYGENLDMRDYSAEVALATLPRDRWGALGLFPNQTEGSVISCPVRLPEGGCELALNADGASAMRVELLDERFAPIKGFSAEHAGAAAGSGLDCGVSWPSDGPSRLPGKTVRLRIRVKRTDELAPRLYAVYLKAR